MDWVTQDAIANCTTERSSKVSTTRYYGESRARVGVPRVSPSGEFIRVKVGRDGRLGKCSLDTHLACHDSRYTPPESISKEERDDHIHRSPPARDRCAGEQ